MSIYFRLCPQDQHTCSDRRCLNKMHDLCMLMEVPATAPTKAVAQQIATKPDEYADYPYYGEYC